MPTYTFEIIETGEQYDEMMKISEKDDYLKREDERQKAVQKSISEQRALKEKAENIVSVVYKVIILFYKCHEQYYSV